MVFCGFVISNCIRDNIGNFNIRYYYNAIFARNFYGISFNSTLLLLSLVVSGNGEKLDLHRLI